MDEQRIIELESRLAFQEDSIQQLNDALCAQQQQLSDLRDTCKLLFERLQDSANASPTGKTPDEIPPHY